MTKLEAFWLSSLHNPFVNIEAGKGVFIKPLGVPAAVRFRGVVKKQQGNKHKQMASFNDYPRLNRSNVAFYCRKRIEKRLVF